MMCEKAPSLKSLEPTRKVNHYNILRNEVSHEDKGGSDHTRIRKRPWVGVEMCQDTEVGKPWNEAHEGKLWPSIGSGR